MTTEAAAYLRVSSQSQSLDMQRDVVTRAARARGDETLAVYAEKRSESTVARPVLDAVRADVRAGTIRRLYVWRLDRLSRRGIRDMLALIEELERNGCEVVTVADGFDLQGPTRDIVLAVIAWGAQFEHEAIKERLAAARARAKARGVRWGRPPRMTQAEVRKLVDLREQGYSLRKLARVLRIPRPTIARTLEAAAKVSQKSPSPGAAKTGRKRNG